MKFRVFQSGFKGFSGVSNPSGNSLENKSSSNVKSVDPFKPINLEPNSQCGPIDFIYSEISELSEPEKKYYKDPSFELFHIPFLPPPKEFC